jgi:hypothetical protein
MLFATNYTDFHELICYTNLSGAAYKLAMSYTSADKYYQCFSRKYQFFVFIFGIAFHP